MAVLGREEALARVADQARVSVGLADTSLRIDRTREAPRRRV